MESRENKLGLESIMSEIDWLQRVASFARKHTLEPGFPFVNRSFVQPKVRPGAECSKCKARVRRIINTGQYEYEFGRPGDPYFIRDIEIALTWACNGEKG